MAPLAATYLALFIFNDKLSFELVVGNQILEALYDMAFQWE
jgi:hypothetical protein